MDDVKLDLKQISIIRMPCNDGYGNSDYVLRPALGTGAIHCCKLGAHVNVKVNQALPNPTTTSIKRRIQPAGVVLPILSCLLMRASWHYLFTLWRCRFNSIIMKLRNRHCQPVSLAWCSSLTVAVRHPEMACRSSAATFTSRSPNLFWKHRGSVFVIFKLPSGEEFEPTTSGPEDWRSSIELRPQT